MFSQNPICPRCLRRSGGKYRFMSREVGIEPGGLTLYGCLQCNFLFHDPNTTKQVQTMKEVRVRERPEFQIVEITFVLGRGASWKNDYQPIIDLMKAQIPVSSRAYDPITKKWEIASEYWPAMEQTLKALAFYIRFISIDQGSNDPNVHVPKEYADNFYHETTPIKTVEDRDSIIGKLTALLECDLKVLQEDELKKAYRKKAREYHPDFGGDAAKMSELNRLYSIYTSKGV